MTHEAIPDVFSCRALVRKVTNIFGDISDNLLCKILDSSGYKIDKQYDIRTYLKEYGFFPSKTFFIFRTVNLFDEEDSTEESEENQLSKTPFLTSTQRQICKKCGGTYIEVCIKCLQNKEFDEGLAEDRKREQHDKGLAEDRKHE